MITAQPSTYAVIGVDEASPAIFVLPVIGWVSAHGRAAREPGQGGERFDPVAIVNIGLETATKSAIYAGEALAFSRKTQAGKFSVYVIDIVIGDEPNADSFNDRFKMILRDRKVK